jgi:PIN domain nuclease of toxin-antitoxin system
MKYLLDTNIFIFLITENFAQLTNYQKEILSDPANTFVLSEASIYEMAIKSRLSKLSFALFSFDEAITTERKQLKISLVKPKLVHYNNIRKIEPVLKNDGKPHADPFDLLIISQALTENLPVVSTDMYFPKYKGLRVVQTK